MGDEAEDNDVRNAARRPTTDGANASVEPSSNSGRREDNRIIIKVVVVVVLRKCVQSRAATSIQDEAVQLLCAFVTSVSQSTKRSQDPIFEIVKDSLPIAQKIYH